jgi:hypothetical protein
MEIVLQPNKGENKAAVPYLAEVKIHSLTIDAGSNFLVPIYVTEVGNQTVYNVEISGFRMETTDLNEVPELVDRLMTGLVNMTRLPSYVFIARRDGGIYPVYTVDNEVMVTTPGGPTFKHVELAKVREYLTDYLHAVGLLGSADTDDKLHVRGINLTSLSLIRPAFYLKKRIAGETEFWTPVFKSDDGQRIYTYAANERRAVPIADGKEILNLHKVVAEALIADKRLKNPYDLRPDRLFPDDMKNLTALLKPETDLTVGSYKIPVYAYNGSFAGVEEKPDEDRFGLFLGKTVAEVEERVKTSFTRRGLMGAKTGMTA